MSVTSPRFSLYRRSNRIFYIGYYTNGLRRWKSTGATTRSDALKALTRFRELLDEPKHNLSFRQFVDNFLAYSSSVHAGKTVALFRGSMMGLLGLVPKAMLRDITPEHIDRYKSIRVRHVKPVSVNIELRMLRSAFSTARRWKLIEDNPCAEVPFVAVPEQSPPFMTVEDFRRLIDQIREPWLREVLFFAVLTGMRRGEILSLQWGNVDLSRKVVHIQSNATFKSKAGRRRTIPLNDAAACLLVSRQGKSNSQYVFTLNDLPIKGDWLTHLFKRYVKKTGLDTRLHWHSARHTFASWLVQGGSTLYEVQRLLGHSSPKVTEIYAHLQPEQLHRTVNRIKVNLN